MYIRKKKSYNFTKKNKIIIFGLTTESKQLYDFYTKKGYSNIELFDNKKETTFIEGNIKDGINRLNNNEKIDCIICCTKKTSRNDINKIVLFSSKNKIELLFILDENERYGKSSYTPVYIDRIIAFKKAPKPLNLKRNKFLKRCFDICFSSVVILFVLSWLFPLLAILIRLTSKGPVLFIQKRNGLNNKEFNCLKFRTMYVNDKSDELQATEGDNRITKIGAFLRKTSIDEFPQFLNVIKGDMSVVGPRPHMIKHNQMYAKLIDHYDQRTLVKPGITGLAQTLGYRGETESDIFLMKIRVRMDIFYINNWSFTLDLKLILKTITKVFFPSKNIF